LYFQAVWGVLFDYSGTVKPLPTSDLHAIQIRTRELWEGAREKKIFLSGGTGFFGVWLLESLAHCNRALDLNVSAMVVCRDPEKVRARLPHIANEGCIHFLEGDVRTFQFPEGQFDYVFHAAAPTVAANFLDAEDVLTTLIDGTRRMISFARSHCTKNFLFVSSGAVYGPQPESMPQISEEHRGSPQWLNPDAAYAEGKRVSEQLCSIAANSSSIRFAIGRCFALVGPHLPLDQHFAIGNFIADALANRRILIRGDGTPMRSYLYASDLAVWLWTLLLAGHTQEANPVVVNVGSGDALSIRDLAYTVANAINPKLQIDVEGHRLPGAPLLQYVPDVSRAEALFGLRPTVDVHDAIRRTAAWHNS
jgi:nucleoside-diphosphate-sugar epimerase